MRVRLAKESPGQLLYQRGRCLDSLDTAGEAADARGAGGKASDRLPVALYAGRGKSNETEVLPMLPRLGRSGKLLTGAGRSD